MKIGIIGATGWLGSATGAKLLAKGVVAPCDLVLLNRSGARADYHGHSDVTWAMDVADLAGQSDVIILSVRPANWPGLGLRAPDKLLISFMAAVGLSALSASGARIVRAMPNAAIEIGASYSPWVAGPGVTGRDRDWVRTILSAIGTGDELATEDQIDLMTAVPGAGAAYPAFMAVAVSRWLTDRGIAPNVAWRATEGMICGGARLLEGRADQAACVLNTYRAYDGTTAAGVAAAEAHGFADCLHAALDAAVSRAQSMTS
ncbi:pyrroline-5-carboxylate reductase family protein [Paracoccus rhizosphaerae]|uniref:Pyrroline-5-carboxylate reductase family protein n=1 Tax=Paracoccus rhizosphaerae TaxID=1133347 RepID=A0ABV6CDP5_9RHOB|nr:pyrroline-5-carboxylate reductase dimerization domain-containing protein [Paracoccus rhizosphaerae]